MRGGVGLRIEGFRFRGLEARVGSFFYFSEGLVLLRLCRAWAGWIFWF